MKSEGLINLQSMYKYVATGTLTHLLGQQKLIKEQESARKANPQAGPAEQEESQKSQKGTKPENKAQAHTLCQGTKT